MPKGPPEKCSRIHSTASEISSYPGILSSTGKGATSMEIGRHGGKTWAYSSARSTIRVSRDIRAGGGGLLAPYLYHHCIRNHASHTRGVSYKRRQSTVRPTSSACLLQSVLIPARIHSLSCQTVRWYSSQHTVTLLSMATQVSSETQSHLTRSPGGAWGYGY